MLMWGSIRTIVPQGTSSVTNIRYYHHIRKSLVARSLSSSATTSEETLTLYQYAICPFCNIVKSVLHYGNLPYKAIEVNPLSKSEVQQFSKEYRKVPILTNSTSTALYGSQEIVQELIPLLQPDKQQSLRTNDKDDEAYQEQQKYWVGFAKDDLAPLLYPNLCNTLRNSYKAFDYVHDPTNPNTFSTLQKYSIQWLGSIAMYLAASKIKKKRNITDERKALHDALQLLEESLAANPSGRYLSSSSSNSNEPERPHLGDLSVYGVLRCVEGLPIHSEVMAQYQEIPKWYQGMKKTVEQQ